MLVELGLSPTYLFSLVLYRLQNNSLLASLQSGSRGCPSDLSICMLVELRDILA